MSLCSFNQLDLMHRICDLCMVRLLVCYVANLEIVLFMILFGYQQRILGNFTSFISTGNCHFRTKVNK